MQPPYRKTRICCVPHQPGDNCAGLHWVREPNDGPDHRSLSQGRYEISPRKTGFPDAEYEHAIFMAAPITCVTVIRGVNGEVSPKALAVAQKTGLPVQISDF